MPTQVASLFKPTSKRDNAEIATTHNAPQAGGQPLSYAEFIVQSKNRAKEKPDHRPPFGDLAQDVFRAAGKRSEIVSECESVANSSTDTWKSRTKDRDPEAVKARSEKSEGPGSLDEDLEQGQKMDESQSSEERPVIAQAVGSGNSIIVSPRQVPECVIKYVPGLPIASHVLRDLFHNKPKDDAAYYLYCMFYIYV